MPKPICFLFLLFLLFSVPAMAAMEWRDVPVGQNSFQSGTIVKAFRENNNAHSYYALSFYAGEGKDLRVIPFETEGGKFTDFVQTEQGADCVTRDYKIDASGAMLLEILRPVADGYATPEIFTFREWHLVMSEGLPGTPPLFWRVAKSWTTQKAYCDVSEAMRESVK